MTLALPYSGPERRRWRLLPCPSCGRRLREQYFSGLVPGTGLPDSPCSDCEAAARDRLVAQVRAAEIRTSSAPRPVASAKAAPAKLVHRDAAGWIIAIEEVAQPAEISGLTRCSISAADGRGRCVSCGSPADQFGGSTSPRVDAAASVEAAAVRAVRSELAMVIDAGARGFKSMDAITEPGARGVKSMDAITERAREIVERESAESTTHLVTISHETTAAFAAAMIPSALTHLANLAAVPPKAERIRLGLIARAAKKKKVAGDVVVAPKNVAGR